REAALRRDSFADSWRQWGRLANLAQGDPCGSTVRLTTMRLIEAGIDVGLDATGPIPGAGLSPRSQGDRESPTTTSEAAAVGPSPEPTGPAVAGVPAGTPHPSSAPAAAPVPSP